MFNVCFRTLFLALTILPVAQLAQAETMPALVPLPQAITQAEGEFVFDKNSTIVVTTENAPALQSHAKVLQESIRRLLGTTIPIKVGVYHKRGDIQLLLNRPDLTDEQYQLEIQQTIKVAASDLAGIARGTATLVQLIGSATDQKLPRQTITDGPDVPFRAFLVDLGRNPHSVQSLKQAIDWLYFYKLNYLHLHISDDQRFAFPSTAYPKLNSTSPDFTLDELKELEAYAAARGVTIIPEMDVPGHSGMLRKHYPEVFGKTPTELANLPSARKGLKTLIDEMLAVFKSTPYFHLGGDEAYGVPVTDQRDFINDLNQHVRQRGKTSIVWEGPTPGTGDNKIATNVIHMCWRSIQFPADKMLEAGYPVINAAWDPLYLVDHYPRNNFSMAAPERVYELERGRFQHFNPDLPSYKPTIVADDQQVMGYCMPWWEGREPNFLLMCPPRIAPMAARAWNPQQETDYQAFAKRAKINEKTLQQISAPVAISASPLAIESAAVFYGKTIVTLSSLLEGDIFYTTDGTEPTQASARYTAPFVCQQDTAVRAAVFEQGQRTGQISQLLLTHVDPVANLALGKPVTSSHPDDPFFCLERLTDGGLGKLDYYLGYMPTAEPIVITVDLEQPTEINEITVHEFASKNAYETYRVEISTDGETFQQIAESTAAGKPEGFATYNFPATQARYLRIVTTGRQNQVFRSFSRLIEIQAFNR